MIRPTHLAVIAAFGVVLGGLTQAQAPHLRQALRLHPDDGGQDGWQASPKRPTSAKASAPVKTTADKTVGSQVRNAELEFRRGVTWLHSFMYEDAIDAFRAAQKADPSFAVAYWGEAISFSQPLWFFEEIDQGRAALAKLGATPAERIAKAKTPRDQGFMRAVEALFGSGDKAARAMAHAREMARVAADHPGDDDAQTFYALALLATMPRGDSALPIRRQAGEIAERVFARNPRHPGAPHYILHAYDHGTLASKALPAARAYARIAPEASHALHMPAHAFLQLGLWDEAAANDEASWNASIAWTKRRGLTIAQRDYHSLAWLQYEWLQQGRFSKTKEAIALVDEAMRSASAATASGKASVSQAVSPQHAGGHGYGEQSDIGRGSNDAALRNDRGSMRARYIIESERWQEMKGQSTFDNIEELFALGLSAVNLGDAPRVRVVIDEFRKASAPSQPVELREQAGLMLQQMQALDLFAQGRHAEAFVALDRAVIQQNRMPRPIGRPMPVKDVNELYGELELQVGRARQAVIWFERALARTPNRSRALLGLARAHRNASDAADARAAYKRFLTNYRLADAGLPEVTEAREALR